MTSTDLDEFSALLRDWADAIVANDADRIGAFATADWVLVGSEGGPGESSRFLDLVRSGDLTHSAMSFDVLDVRVYGDVAVVLAHGTNEGSWQGTHFGADEWSTNVFVRRGRSWRCSVTALTPNYAAEINRGH